MNEEQSTREPAVLHYANGNVMKCYVVKAEQERKALLVTTDDGICHKIRNRDLKALFYVKDFIGNDRHVENRRFPEGFQTTGAKVGVKFTDGERIVGVSHDYSDDSIGFHLVPADGRSNNRRIYLVRETLAQCVVLH